MTADTFAEAIKNKKYKKDECWINALFDVYGETLLDPFKNKRYVITRETILQVIGKTEENIKDGLVWEDIALLREVQIESKSVWPVPQTQTQLRTASVEH